MDILIYQFASYMQAKLGLASGKYCRNLKNPEKTTSLAYGTDNLLTCPVGRNGTRQ